MGVGGTVDVKGLKISMTPAVHTSSIEEDGKVHYVGLATGFFSKSPNSPIAWMACNCKWLLLSCNSVSAALSYSAGY